MLVYRDSDRPAEAEAEIAALDSVLKALAGGADARDLATEALIDAGALEAAIVDALNPERDGFGRAEAAWRAVSLAAARAFRAARRADPAAVRAAAGEGRAALERARRMGPPARLTLRTPEGYAWYALYPETYLAAAERYLAASRSGPAVVVGLRGIGASLAATVAVALEAVGRPVDSLTVRPRGHPFGRTLRLSPVLAARLRRAAEEGAAFLIVDEGPGLSGSSFAGTAAALSELGAADAQIVLFPSVEADAAAFRSPAARERWARHARFRVGFEEMAAELAPALDGARDLSGGRWRELVCDGARPPVAPQHERRKYLSADGTTLRRYAGLGRSGRVRLRRAERLAEAGFAAPPGPLRDGFLAAPFLKGRPMRARERGPEAHQRAAAYLGWLGREAAYGEAVAGDELFPMIERNVELTLGPAGVRRLRGLERWRPRLRDAPKVAVDGRMAPHEWIRAGETLIKTDAVDHHDDHFLPGPTDLAWDVAGFGVEWGLAPDAADAFAAEVARQARDADLPGRAVFYETAYLAQRAGWTAMAAASLADGFDRRGLRRQHARYRARLDRALDRPEWNA